MDIRYARRFDPTRPQEQLDQILTFNGLEWAVGNRTAPRGCLGHDLALDLSLKIINAFLPG